MIELAHRYATVSDLELHHLTGEGHDYLCLLSTGNDRSYFMCWSAEAGANVGDLLRSIHSRLSSKERLSDAVAQVDRYFPDDWDYWGGGIPAPLREFYRYRRDEIDLLPLKRLD